MLSPWFIRNHFQLITKIQLLDVFEKALKDYIFKQISEYKDSAKFNIMLSYRIQGGFYAYQENYKRFSIDDITDTITYINKDATLLDWT